MATLTHLATRLAEAEERYVAANPESRRLHEQRTLVMPGGNTRTTIHQPPFPLTIAHGEGARIVDVDGHEYPVEARGVLTEEVDAAGPRSCSASIPT